MFYYAGIGSRDTPQHICELMHKIGHHLAKTGWILRSGHARGADRAFENACDEVGGLKEIFTAKNKITSEALDLAEKFHPAWHNCDAYAQKLHARNGYIILGEDLKTPVNIVLCYSPGGFEKGGTSQGLRIAKANRIPILNLFEKDVYLNLKHTYMGIYNV